MHSLSAFVFAMALICYIDIIEMQIVYMLWNLDIKSEFNSL